MRKKNYESPQMEVASIENMQIICTSGTTQQYEEGSTDDWYDWNN